MISHISIKITGERDTTHQGPYMVHVLSVYNNHTTTSGSHQDHLVLRTI